MAWSIRPHPIDRIPHLPYVVDMGLLHGVRPVVLYTRALS